MWEAYLLAELAFARDGMSKVFSFLIDKEDLQKLHFLIPSLW